MTNNDKVKQVEDLREKISRAKSVIFAEYTGLDANKMNALRKDIKEKGAEITITKNTLMRRALDEESVGDELSGQILTVFSYEDPVSPLKKLVDFAKENEYPSIRIGLIEGAVASTGQILELSELPTKEELIARVVGGIRSPLTGIVNALSGPQRKLIYALSAVAEKKAA